jgi:hypothetical protein
MDKVTELLKYPITVLSITLCLIGLSKCGGFDNLKAKFGDTELSAQSANNTKVSASLENRIQVLEQIVSALNTHNRDSNVIKTTLDTSVYELNTVNDAQVLKLVQQEQKMAVQSGSKTQTDGWIFIGNYNPATNTWDRLNLVDEMQQLPPKFKPEDINIGSTFKVSGNMSIRKSLPPNDAMYYNGVKQVGVALRNTKVRVEEKPVGIDREVFVQYWMRISTE